MVRYGLMMLMLAFGLTVSTPSFAGCGGGSHGAVSKCGGGGCRTARRCGSRKRCGRSVRRFSTCGFKRCGRRC